MSSKLARSLSVVKKKKRSTHSRKSYSVSKSIKRNDNLDIIDTNLIQRLLIEAKVSTSDEYNVEFEFDDYQTLLPYSARTSTLTSITEPFNSSPVSNSRCDETFTDKLSSISKSSKIKRKKRKLSYSSRISSLPSTPEALISPSNKIIIPTKTVVKLYKKKLIKFSSPNSIDIEKVEYFGSPVHFTPSQQSILDMQRKKESREERIERIKKANIRASRINKFAAKYLTGNKKQIHTNTINYINQKILAIVQGWIVRWKIRYLKNAAIKIQFWYREMIPLYRQFKKYYQDLQKNRKYESKITFTQNILRWNFYIKNIHNQNLINSIIPLQSCIETLMHMKNFQYQISTIIFTQCSMRKVLVVDYYELQYLEEKLLYMKLSVLRRYEVLNAPYSRRSLFCYKTRQITKNAYSIALREYKYIESRKTLFMERKTYHHHLQFIATQLLKHVNNPNFVKIIKNVFDEDKKIDVKKKVTILNRITKFFKTKKQSSNDLSNVKKKSEEIKRLKKVIIQIIPNMFSDQKGIVYANWSSLLVYSFVIHDLLTPNIQFDKNDINLSFMVDTNSTHKIPYNKI